jgi:hypothetical protein
MRQETRKARSWTPKPTKWVGERETLAGARHAFLASAAEARRYAEDRQRVGVEVQCARSSSTHKSGCNRGWRQRGATEDVTVESPLDVGLLGSSSP